MVRAHAIMQSIGLFEETHGPLPEGLECFDHNAHLGALIHSAIASDQPLLIVGDDGQKIGVVTREDLLKTVIDGAETS